MNGKKGIAYAREAACLGAPLLWLSGEAGLLSALGKMAVLLLCGVTLGFVLTGLAFGVPDGWGLWMGLMALACIPFTFGALAIGW